MKVMVVIGTRPEAIKLASIVSVLKQRNVDTIVCSTGQHRQMLDQAFDAFDIKPDIDLNLMQDGQSLNELSSRLIVNLDKVYVYNKPDWVLVQGDTTSALCGALSAFHRGIKVGHIEAGLRTGQILTPFPEEANRSILARIATKHFCPTGSAKRALIKENISEDIIHVTGNTVIDAINLAKSSPKFSSAKLPPKVQYHLNNSSIVLVTCHRRENFGPVIIDICKLLGSLCDDYSDHCFVFPVHLNPEIRQPATKYLSHVKNLILMGPLDYHSNLYLLSQACIVISDSGGMQEEAPSFGVPLIILRSHTERPEGINASFAVLAGRDPEVIKFEVKKILDNTHIKKNLRDLPNPYGDGKAAQRIVEILIGNKIEEFNG